MGGLTAVLAFAGGTWFPVGHGTFYQIARLLPSYWLVQASHVALGGGGWSAFGWAVVAAWSVVLSVLAARAYVRTRPHLARRRVGCRRGGTAPIRSYGDRVVRDDDDAEDDPSVGRPAAMRAAVAPPKTAASMSSRTPPGHGPPAGHRRRARGRPPDRGDADDQADRPDPAGGPSWATQPQ